jgi:hypothetical protein
VTLLDCELLVSSVVEERMTGGRGRAGMLSVFGASKSGGSVADVVGGLTTGRTAAGRRALCGPLVVLDGSSLDKVFFVDG